MRPWILKSALVIAAGMLAAGCSSAGSGGGDESPDAATPASGTPSASASPTPSPAGAPAQPFTSVTVTRSGGLAGFNDQYTVATDGALTVQTKGVAAKPAKKLAAAELTQLKALMTSPELAAEAKQGRFAKAGCRDGFNYGLVSGSLRLGGTDCGSLASDAPTFWKVVQLVEKAAQTP